MDCFDPESGQVYREAIVKPRRRDRDWQLKCVGRKPTEVLSLRGADQLAAMAMRKLVCNADQLEPEALRALPSKIAQDIRSAIKRHGSESFHVWKTFVESGHADRTFQHSATLSKPTYKPLVDIFCDVASERFAWIVDLKLDGVYCSHADLRQIATIPNLRSLQVTYPDPNRASQNVQPFGDDVLYNLASRAVREGVLSRLQMIFVQNARFITSASLAYLNNFPKLDTFCALGTTIKSQQRRIGNQYGWKCHVNSHFKSFATQKYMRQDAGGSVSYFQFASLVCSYVQRRYSDLSDENSNLPSLDMRIYWHGTPSIRHEISEFACFQRDLLVSKDGMVSGHTNTVPIDSVRVLNQSLPVKKRKLKDGKAIALDTMLNGM